jgi:hypothetical protein
VIKDAIVKALGPSNRKVKRVSLLVPEHADERVIVEWAINENLTEGLTKDTARLEAAEILRAARDAERKVHKQYNGIFLQGSYPLVDQFGNAKEETVVRADYSQATLNRINFDGINFKDIFDIADSAEIHPAFQY